MRSFLMLILAAITLAASQGCASVAGVVVDPRGKPHPTAAFSVGRPDGLGSYANHRVNKEGRFKFSILGSDENYLWVYDSESEPMATARRIDRTEISDHMRIVLPRIQNSQDASFGHDRQVIDHSMKETGVPQP